MSTPASWKSRVPWRIKLASKIVLSRLPVPYAVWSRLNLFKHGFMQDSAYAESIFHEHFAQVSATRRQPGFTCLELGPGDSLLSAIVAKKHGAARTYLVDVGAFADRDIARYQEAAAALGAEVGGDGNPAGWESVDDMLRCSHAEYLTSGVASLQTIPDASVDFIWSQAVLEHVRRNEFAAVMRETRRILRPGGVASHRVDLRDHLGGKLNNLRFSEARWEGDLFSQSGFYTNRLRYTEILDLARQAGFEVRSTRKDEWSALPTPRAQMSREFQGFTDEDLRIQGFFMTLAAT